MSVSIISFRYGCIEAYHEGNVYVDDKVEYTIFTGYDPVSDAHSALIEQCRNEIRPCAFYLANAFAQSVETFLALHASPIEYIEKNWSDLRKGKVYVIYTDGYELALVKKTLELYDVNAACYFEQHLMALSCDNHDDICCRILYGDKFCDAYYSPYVCRVLNAGNLPVPGDLEYKVEKTYKLPDREIMSFMLACATLRYCSDKHYREFLCDFEPPCFMVNG
jgi:hypothetical protein